MIGDKQNSAPSSNRGAVTSLPNSLTACVDWFSATFFDIKSWEEICALIGLPIDKFKVKDKGLNGYLKSAIWDNIQFYFDGQPGMGIWLNLGGQGCRQYEALFEEGGCWDWYDFFEYVLNVHSNITRLDIALDDFKGIFKIKDIESCCRRGCVASRFRTARNFEEIDLESGATLGQTIYFGKTDVIIRFYDKYHERIAKGFALKTDIDTWIRSEIQLRGDRAKAALEVIVNNDIDLGEFLRGVLNRYLAFKIKGQDKIRSRWKNCKWWDTFLNDVGKIRLSLTAPDKTVLRTKEWVDKQVLASLATLYASCGSDKLFLDYIIEKGNDQMSDEQRELADEFVRDDISRNRLKSEMSQYLHDKREFRQKKLTKAFIENSKGILEYSTLKRQNRIKDEFNLI